MEKSEAMTIMSALSQPTRLEVFRKLVDALPDGMASGDLAVATGASPNTMSSHLAILARAGIVASHKVGRTVVYRAVTRPVEELSAFLASSCSPDATSDAGPRLRRDTHPTSR